MQVTEVAPAASPADQLIELRDPSPEVFPLPAYSVAATDGSGAVLGSQVLTAPPPFPFRNSTAPFLLGGANVGARERDLALAIPAGATRVCFYASGTPPDGLVSCLDYSSLTIPSGQSAQRQSCGLVDVAAPTPDAPNAETGACSGGAGGGGGGGGGGGPTSPAADLTPPLQRVTGKRRQDVDRLAVRVAVSEAGSVTVRASVNVPAAARLLRFKSVTRNVTANRPVKLRLRLARGPRGAVQAALGRGVRLVARVAIVARDVAGNLAPVAERRIRLSD